MKLILSRKGFDSAAGGVASPILPSGRLCSLPIPDATSTWTYSDIRGGDANFGTLVHDLASKVTPRTTAHLDPDLDYGSVPRKEGWKPLFGQTGAAQSHLQNQGVGRGDLFLYYGWFRKVERSGGTYRYVRGAPDVHVIFGWLQVDKKVRVAGAEVPDWATDHVHFQREKPKNENETVYFSADELRLGASEPLSLPGAGVFERYHPRLRLTAPERSRCVWRLPSAFYPERGKTPLSYHNLDRWTAERDYTLVKTAGRGQEFVLDCVEYPDVIPWLADTLCVAEG